MENVPNHTFSSLLSTQLDRWVLTRNYESDKIITEFMRKEGDLSHLKPVRSVTRRTNDKQTVT